MAGKRATAAAWANRDEAARELSAMLGWLVTRRTIGESWMDLPDCPFPKGKKPIPKAPVIAWATKRAIPPGAQRVDASGKLVAPTESPEQRLKRMKLEQELHALQRKNAEKDALTVPADEARAAINLAMAALKHDLLDELPQDIWSDCQRTAVEVAVVAIRKHLSDALNRFAEQVVRLKSPEVKAS